MLVFEFFDLIYRSENRARGIYAQLDLSSLISKFPIIEIPDAATVLLTNYISKSARTVFFEFQGLLRILYLF